MRHGKTIDVLTKPDGRANLGRFCPVEPWDKDKEEKGHYIARHWLWFRQVFKTGTLDSTIYDFHTISGKGDAAYFRNKAVPQDLYFKDLGIEYIYLGFIVMELLK